MLTDEQVDELVRQVPFGREPYITFRAVFRAGMMEAARIAQDAEYKLSERTRERDELKEWSDAAVASCAKHQCSMRDARLRESEARAEAAEAQLAERTRELAEAKAEARRWKARAKDAEEELDDRDHSASTEAMWKARQGDDYGSY